MLLCTIVVSSLLAVTISTVKIEEIGPRAREPGPRRRERARGGASTRSATTHRSPRPTFHMLKQPGDTGYDTAKKGNEQPPKDPGDAGYDANLDPRVNPELLAARLQPRGDLVEVDAYPVRGLLLQRGPLAVRRGRATGSRAARRRRRRGRAPGRRRLPGRPEPRLRPDHGRGAHLEDHLPVRAARCRAGTQAYITATNGQMVYTGATPLRITGGVEVKNQVAAVTADGTPGPGARRRRRGRTGRPRHVRANGRAPVRHRRGRRPEQLAACRRGCQLDLLGRGHRADLQRVDRGHDGPGWSAAAGRAGLGQRPGAAQPLPRLGRQLQPVPERCQPGVYDVMPTDCQTLGPDQQRDHQPAGGQLHGRSRRRSSTNGGAPPTSPGRPQRPCPRPHVLLRGRPVLLRRGQPGAARVRPPQALPGVLQPRDQLGLRPEDGLVRGPPLDRPVPRGV